MSGIHRWRATERPGDGAVVEVVDAADHDRIVSALTEAGLKMQAERDRLAERVESLEGTRKAELAATERLAERCRELEACMSEPLARLVRERDTLRAEVERLTALQLPPGHLPMPRRMLELLIGDPQDPYRANAESVASEMLSGALPDPTSHEREFNAVRNVRLLLSEVERLRKDAERINKLAAQARMIYGHKDQASYQLSELHVLIQSSREECLPDDLRRAIDDMEASR